MALLPRGHGASTSILIVLFGLACFSVFAGLQSFSGLHSLTPTAAHMHSAGGNGHQPLRRTVGGAALPKACRGKEQLLELLERPNAACHLHHAAAATSSKTQTSRRHVLGMTTCNVHDMCQQLPTWKQIQKAYGSTSLVEVQRPRERHSSTNGHGEDNRPLRVLGLPGTTSAVAALLQQGKETSRRAVTELEFPTQKLSARDATTATVCVVRDPFRWMADMCHNPPSSLHWIIPNPQHCPNLVPSPNDPLLARTRLHTYTVQSSSQQQHGERGMISTTTTTYASLVDLWASYVQHHTTECDVTVRWEDAVLLAPDAVRSAVLGTLPTTTLEHKSRVREWSAWTRGRYAGMERGDLVYAQLVLRSDVLRKWGYLPVPVLG